MNNRGRVPAVQNAQWGTGQILEIWYIPVINVIDYFLNKIHTKTKEGEKNEKCHRYVNR